MQARVQHHEIAGAQRLLERDGFGMALERAELVAGERLELTAMAAERMAYVLRGTGTAEIAGATHPLDRESVLWLDPGDTAAVLAGADGLALLVAAA